MISRFWPIRWMRRASSHRKLLSKQYVKGEDWFRWPYPKFASWSLTVILPATLCSARQFHLGGIGHVFHTPMFALEVDGKPCGIVPRAIGGSYAVLVAEQLLASGARIVVGLTSAGRVSQILRIPSLVIATAAIRDEGTSFHHLPPSKSVAAPPNPVAPLASELERLGAGLSRKVWTTDAPYRETRQQLERYGEEGVLAVEMQAASLFALAQARKAQIAVVAHVSNATDHEGEPFDRGPETEGVQVLMAVCRAGLVLSRNNQSG